MKPYLGLVESWGWWGILFLPRIKYLISQLKHLKTPLHSALMWSLSSVFMIWNILNKVALVSICLVNLCPVRILHSLNLSPQWRGTSELLFKCTIVLGTWGMGLTRGTVTWRLARPALSCQFSIQHLHDLEESIALLAGLNAEWQKQEGDAIYISDSLNYIQRWWLIFFHNSHSNYFPGISLGHLTSLLL